MRIISIKTNMSVPSVSLGFPIGSKIFLGMKDMSIKIIL